MISAIRTLVFAARAGLMVLLGCAHLPATADWVERPDAMHWHRLADFDQIDGRVRILYYSQPSLEQSVQPGWTINAYIAELHADGRIENRRLATGQRNFADLKLQRGGDGVFALIVPEKGEPGHTLEYWSAQDGAVRASSRPPEFDASIPKLFPTDDGNLFVVTQSAQSSRGDQPTELSLTRLSPEGSNLASSTWTNPTAIANPGGAFEVPGGGMGVSVNLRGVRGVEALATDIEAIQQYDIAGRTLEARVLAETRLLAMDSAGNLLWQSPALERDLAWQGEMAIPQDLPYEQIMAQNQEQMALMDRVNRENGGGRNLIHLTTEGLDDIQSTPSGFGMLTQVTADRRLEPPLHGLWYIEVGHDGGILRELRIEPAAERLEAKFETFMPQDNGGLLVAGVRRARDPGLHVTALDRDGGVEWTARLDMKAGQIEGLAGSASAPWVFGQSFSEAGNKNLLWAERVEPGHAERPAAPAATSAATSRPAETAQAASPMGIELPEPADGCTCSCEEFAKIEELSDQMKSAAQADVIAILSDPGFQSLMSCASSCAMQYAKCR